MKRLIIICVVLDLIAGVLLADVWQDLAVYKMSEAEDLPTVEVSKLILMTPAGELGDIEEKLIEIVQSANTTAEAKWFSCRMLQRIGSEHCVPALAPLVKDPVFSHYARLVLERMVESEQAGEILRPALMDAPEELKPGIIGSIAARGDNKAIQMLGRLAQDGSAAVARAALQALGKIGGTEGRNVLERVKIATELKTERLSAMVQCAEGLKDSAFFMQIYKEADSDIHKGASLRGLICTDAKVALPLILEHLNGNNGSLRNAALAMIADANGGEFTKLVADSLGNMAPELQVAVIGLLGVRGDSAALAAVEALIGASDVAVSTAARRSAALLGNKDTAGVLLAIETAEDKAKEDEVVECLSIMPDPEVNQVLITALQKEDGSVRAIRALEYRLAVEAVPALKQLTHAKQPEIKAAAWKALSKLAVQDDLNDLMNMTLALTEESDRKNACGCMKDVCGRIEDKDAAMGILGKNYENADDSTKTFILDLAAAAGGQKGLDYVRSALKSGNQVLYDKAVRVLAAWSTPDADVELLDLANRAPEGKARILALRGYISCIAMSDMKSQMDKISIAVALVKRPDEKKLLLSIVERCAEPGVYSVFKEYLQDPDVKAESAIAVLKKAGSLAAIKEARTKKRKGKQVTIPVELVELLELIAADKDIDETAAENARRLLALVQAF